jgi:hypothetical protein
MLDSIESTCEKTFPNLKEIRCSTEKKKRRNVTKSLKCERGEEI